MRNCEFKPFPACSFSAEAKERKGICFFRIKEKAREIFSKKKKENEMFRFGS